MDNGNSEKWKNDNDQLHIFKQHQWHKCVFKIFQCEKKFYKYFRNNLVETKYQVMPF